MVSTDDDRTVRCTACRNPVGYYVTVGGQTWLQVFDLKLRSAHGVCARCGAEFHWSASDKMLDDLLERCKR